MATAGGGTVNQIDPSSSNKPSKKQSSPIHMNLFFHKAIRSELDAQHRIFWQNDRLFPCLGLQFIYTLNRFLQSLRSALFDNIEDGGIRATSKCHLTCCDFTMNGEIVFG